MTVPSPAGEAGSRPDPRPEFEGILTLAGKLSALAIVISIALAGCEETAKRAAQVRPNVPVPVPVPALADRGQRLPLPSPLPPASLRLTQLITEPQPTVDALVRQVAASFEAGKRDYRAGNLDSAREDFNRAVDLIMSSGIDVESDPRLKDLFDRLAETIRSYELEASNDVEETSDEQKGEPAPIEEIAGLSLPAGDPRLAQRAEQELITVSHDLPLTVNDSVLSYLSFFMTLRGRAIVETGLRRAGLYRDMIRRVLKEEGVPQDLIFLAQAESAFKPLALSRAGARGIWQFMPFRGREYDLEHNRWVDERNDPEKATRAAARHLRDLYQMFGDWYLTMSAYNSGPMNVARAIERTGYADFWELQKRNALPKETKNYVPIILALTLIAKDPALYGIHVEPETPELADEVKPGRSIDLRLVADIVDANVDALRTLNPELIRLSTPDDPDFTLRLPAGTADRFRAETALIPPGKWLAWRRHRVEEGETLESIARRFHLSPASVAEANRLSVHDPLLAGSKITIPAAAPPQGQLVRYRVRRGDTLEGIAARFDVSVAELRRWNGIRGKRPPRGARLKIFQGGEPPLATAKHANGKLLRSEKGRLDPISQKGRSSEALHHRVKPGETLYSIARLYRTTVEALRHTNPFLAERPLETGDILTILPH